MTHGAVRGVVRYKQLNDLITSCGSSTVITAYGENHSEASYQMLSCRRLLRLVVGGWKEVFQGWIDESSITMAKRPHHYVNLVDRGYLIQTFFLKELFSRRSSTSKQQTTLSNMRMMGDLVSWIMHEADNYPHAKCSSVTFRPFSIVLNADFVMQIQTAQLNLFPVISE